MWLWDTCFTIVISSWSSTIFGKELSPICATLIIFIFHYLWYNNSCPHSFHCNGSNLDPFDFFPMDGKAGSVIFIWLLCRVPTIAEIARHFIHILLFNSLNPMRLVRATLLLQFTWNWCSCISNLTTVIHEQKLCYNNKSIG